MTIPIGNSTVFSPMETKTRLGNENEPVLISSTLPILPAFSPLVTMTLHPYFSWTWFLIPKVGNSIKHVSSTLYDSSLRNVLPS